jgi:NADH-quinone oxidoreductase subunit E
MSLRRLAPSQQQPESFAFTPAHLDQAKAILGKYPPGRQFGAVVPLFDLAQRQEGWLTLAAIKTVAEMLEMPLIRALEVATFYTMFELGPAGRHVVRICTTTPCWLRGSDAIAAQCRKTLGIDFGQTTADGMFSLREVECLGACVNAPVMQVGDDNFEDVDPASAQRILEGLRQGLRPKPGPQVARHASAPIGGPTTLTTAPSGKSEDARR